VFGVRRTGGTEGEKYRRLEDEKVGKIRRWEEYKNRCRLTAHGAWEKAKVKGER